MKNQALLIVDVQNDFCPGGTLPVPEGDLVIPVLNQYIATFSKKKLLVFASRDWHPPQTRHFREAGGKWPVHCVQNTRGALFPPQLQISLNTLILSKGMDPDQDGYSAFEAKDNRGAGFLDILQKLQIKELFIGGLATDYCVKATVLDALKLGFKVNLLTDAIQGVNSADSQKAVQEMIVAGARPLTFEELSLK